MMEKFVKENKSTNELMRNVDKVIASNKSIICASVASNCQHELEDSNAKKCSPSNESMICKNENARYP